MVVVIKLAKGQQIIPVILALICEVPEISLKLLVNTLSLTVGLWMVSHRRHQFDS
jgi:hypothetical protein